MSNARVPPQNLEAEESVLGAIMLSPNVLPVVTEIVRPEDFYRESHAQILRAAIRFARLELGLERVLVTCDEGNEASIRVIEKNHGVLEEPSQLATLRCPKRRYWIDASGDAAARYLEPKPSHSPV